MKKFLPIFVLGLMFCAARGEDEANRFVHPDELAVPAQEITAEEAAACDRIAQKLNARYAELALHEIVETAMQKIADENREDFEIALRVRGVDAEDVDGNIVHVLPLPTYFIIR